MIDLKKYQDKEFLISGICLAIGTVLLIAFYVSFSVYINSETKAIDVNIKSFRIWNKAMSNTTVPAEVTETTPITTATATAITTTVPETTGFSVVFTTSKAKKTTTTTSASNTSQRQTVVTQTNRPTTSVKTTTVKKTVKKTTTTKRSTREKTTTTATTYSAADEKQTQILKLVNQKRKQVGLKSLKPLISLDNAALIRAKEIAGNFSHTRPNGKGGETVLSDKNIEFSTYVENIGEGNETAEEIFNVWWNSTAGKANILNKKVKYIGTACYYYPSDPNKYFYYWVQIFYC